MDGPRSFIDSRESVAFIYFFFELNYYYILILNNITDLIE